MIIGRKSIWILIFCMLPFWLFATEIRQDSTNTENHPEIVFDFNVFDPVIQNKNAFILTEDGKSLDFEFNQLPQTPATGAKTILILWEDMSNKTHPGQKLFYQQLLTNTLPQFVSPGDRVNISVFSRSTEGQSTINLLLPSFTDDVSTLVDVVNSYESVDNLWYRQQSTDLYGAVLDGLNYLSTNFSPGEDRILLVLTAGYNNRKSNQPTPDAAILKAIKERIPIYNAQYYMQGWEHHRISPLIYGTYGKEVVTKRITDASDSLNMFMTQAQQRLQGQNYQISFQSSTDKDGAQHSVKLHFKSEAFDIQFSNPKQTFGEWLKENPLVLWGSIFGILLIIGLVIFLLVRSSKKKKAAAAAATLKERQQKDEMDAMRQKGEKEKKELEQNQDKLRQELDAERTAREAKLAKEQEEARLAELLLAMKQKGQLPRLYFEMGGEKGYYEINQPEFSLGRSPENSVSLNHQTVSRKHARVFFREGKYFIEDLGSSNGTWLNEVKITQTEINNNDHIRLGDIRFIVQM